MLGTLAAGAAALGAYLTLSTTAIPLGPASVVLGSDGYHYACCRANEAGSACASILNVDLAPQYSPARYQRCGF